MLGRLKNFNNVRFYNQAISTVLATEKNYIILLEYTNKKDDSLFITKSFNKTNISTASISASCTGLRLRYSKYKKNIKKAETNMYRYLFSIHFFFFIKIKIRGKGYRIRRKKKMLKFIAYLSHTAMVQICKSFLLRKPGKYKFMLFSKNFDKLKRSQKNIVNIKHADLYTKRGLKAGRQKLKKREGKKSAYMKKQQ